MSTAIDRALERLRPDVPARTSRMTILRVLLACGVAYPLVYAIANDVIAASLYEGYSRMSQTISELSATGASTRPFLIAMLPVFSGLLAAFGVGVWKSAHGKRALRVTGGLLIAYGVTGPLWLLAPMSQREVLAAGGGTSGDTMHLVLSAWTGLFVFSLLGFGAAAFGKRFRLYCLATAVTVAVSSGLMGIWSPDMEAGEPTPWLGLAERIMMAAWMLWIAVLAIVLLKAQGSAAIRNRSQALRSGELGVNQRGDDGSRRWLRHSRRVGGPSQGGVGR